MKWPHAPAIFVFIAFSSVAQCAHAQQPNPEITFVQAYTDSLGVFGSHLMVMNADGSWPFEIYSAHQISDPSWSADGKHITFSIQQSGSCNSLSMDLWMIDISIGPDSVIGSNPHKIVDGVSGNEGFRFSAWSPRGNEIAFCSATPMRCSVHNAVYTVPAGGGTSTELYGEDSAFCIGASWSSDGSELACVMISQKRATSGWCTIPIIQRSTGAVVQRLLQGQTWIFNNGYLDWSRSQPNSFCFYARPNTSTTANLQILDATSGAVSTISSTLFCIGPSWSSDDSKMVYYYQSGASVSINSYDLTTGSSTVLFLLSTGTNKGVHGVNWKRPNVRIPLPELSVSPVTLNYGNVTVDVPDTLRVTVKNVSLADTLILSHASIQGSTDFSISDTPKSLLLPGDTGSYSITLTPTSGGVRSARLVISSNGVDSGSRSILLTGTGLAPVIELASASLFRAARVRLRDSLVKYEVIQNTGLVPLLTVSAGVAGDYPDAYRVIRVPGPIPPEGIDSIGVEFQPTLAARLKAQLVLHTNAPGGPTLIDLVGTGIIPQFVLTPPSVAFDSIILGESACQTVQISNPGSDTLTIVSQYVASSDPDFSVTPVLGDALRVPPADSESFAICFAPIQRGFRLARLGIQTNIPKTFEDPARDTSEFFLDITGAGVPSGLLTAGPVALDSTLVMQSICENDTIENTGTDNFLITGVEFGDTTEFSLKGISMPLSLRPGEKLALDICSTPDTEGLRQSLITLIGTTAEKTRRIGVPVAVFGESVTIAGAGIAPETPLGSTSAPFDVTLANSGNVSWVPGTPAVTGPFTYISGGSDTIPAGGAAALKFTFMPTAVGTNSGQATFPLANLKESPAFVLLLTGSGVSVAGVESQETTGEYQLLQNSPNPCGNVTSILYFLPAVGDPRLILRDVLGREVKNMPLTGDRAGWNRASLDASELPLGTYTYELIAGDIHIEKRMIKH